MGEKGGPKVLEIVNKLNSNSIPTILELLAHKKIAKSKYIKNLGFIDKKENMEKYILELQSGILNAFSKRKHMASNRDCLYLGVPIICHDVGYKIHFTNKSSNTAVFLNHFKRLK